MDRSVPTFSGYTTHELVINFIEEFYTFCEIKGFNDERKMRLLPTLLRGAARTAFEEGKANGEVPNPVSNTDGARLDVIYEWLRSKYHTDNMKQSLKDQVTNSYQGMQESLMAFYTRIRHMIELAGYPNTVKDQVAETMFMGGVSREIATNIRTSPYPMNLDQKVDYAQQYWITMNPGQEVEQLALPPRLKEAMVRPNMQPQQHLHQQPQQQASPNGQWQVKPATVNWQNYGHNNTMDQLAEQMNKMTAHIAELTKQNEEISKRMLNQPRE